MMEDIFHREAEPEVNHIKELYIKTRAGGIPTRTELLQRHVTDYFWAGYFGAIKHRELVNYALRGKTGSSKSTVGCKLMYQGIRHMQKLGWIKVMTEEELQEYLYSRICSDQTEFLRFAMKDAGETISLIDEFSSMGETGFNATTEQAMYNEHSDLFAQERIHKISCSPTHVHDKNADIILDVLGIDEKNKVTQLMLNYRDHTEWITYPLGVVNIYVGDVIEMPFYKRYRKKKFARLDLLKKHGIRNVKELEFARITITTYHRLKELAKVKRISQEMILSMVDAVRRENKMQYSILTLNYVVMNVKALLDTVTEIDKLKRAIEKVKDPEISIIYTKNVKQYENILEYKIKDEVNKIEIEDKYRQIT